MVFVYLKGAHSRVVRPSRRGGFFVSEGGPPTQLLTVGRSFPSLVACIRRVEATADSGESFVPEKDVRSQTHTMADDDEPSMEILMDRSKTLQGLISKHAREGRVIPPNVFDTLDDVSIFLQCSLLRTTLRNGPNLIFIINFAVIHLTLKWDDSIWEALLAALSSLQVGFAHEIFDVGDIHLSCLRLVSSRASILEPAQVHHVLSLPNMVIAVMTKKTGLSEVAKLIRSATSAKPPAQICIDLLCLQDLYNLSLDASVYEDIVNNSISNGQPDEIKTALGFFFRKRNQSVMLSVATVRMLVKLQSTLLLTPSALLNLCDTQRSIQLAIDLIVAGVEEQSPSWSLAAVREVAARGIQCPAGIVSILAEAFLAPSAVPNKLQTGTPQAKSELIQVNDGYIAALLALKLMVDGSHKGLRQLSPVANNRLVGCLLASTPPPEFMDLRPLALDMAPSKDDIMSMLSDNKVLASLPPGSLSKMLSLADKGLWSELSLPLLAALKQLPPQQQASELHDGGGASLAKLLVLDRVFHLPCKEGAAPGYLVDFLHTFVLGDLAASPFSQKEWHSLVQMLLDIGDGLPADKDSDIMLAVRELLGLAATALPGEEYYLNETLWQVEQVGRSDNPLITHLITPSSYHDKCIIKMTNRVIAVLLMVHTSILHPANLSLTHHFIGPSFHSRPSSVVLKRLSDLSRLSQSLDHCWRASVKEAGRLNQAWSVHLVHPKVL